MQQSRSSHRGYQGFSNSRPSSGGRSLPSGRQASFRRGAPSRFGGASHPNKRPSFGDRIDPNRFINKAVITEVVENFIPEHKFADFAIDETLKQAIIGKGYTVPTPIQDRAIPHILLGRDVVGVANTGTGKTAAFLVPLLHKVRLNPKEHVLIIVPTRELANQIESELRGFTKGTRIFGVCCVGGMSISRQIADLRRPYNFVIGTPGRLKDLIERKVIDRSKFATIVLDEADRMLDMGFINDMRYVMAGMPKPRHTLFFSATISPDIEKLIKDFLTDPVRISVKTGDTAKNVDQDVMHIGMDKTKLDVLHGLLNNKEFRKVLVFGRTKHGVEKLSHLLAQKGFRAESIHGNKNQNKRDRALKLFRDNQVQVLVATDVAARGLDIADISHVINYDIPATYDDYVHRIGRTGRAGKGGKAITFIDPKEPRVGRGR